jgi:hypothetical protein
VTTTAPLWQSQFTVQHRIWGLRSLFAGIADEFRDATGLRRGPPHGGGEPSAHWAERRAAGALLVRAKASTSLV